MSIAISLSVSFVMGLEKHLHSIGVLERAVFPKVKNLGTL
jgi:hypothetical protein